MVGCVILAAAKILGELPVIEYQEYTKSYLLTCDKCGQHDAVATARDLQKAREIAVFWKWELDTPVGDLCLKCSKVQQDQTYLEKRKGSENA